MTAETTIADGPLGGVRVIDLTSVIMGPFATHIMADLGADVIKIETPEGDSFRSYRPFRSEGMSGGFLHLNRNKRSVVLDLRTPDGKAVMERLVATADVFIHSLRPDSISGLGLDYASVRRLKEDIVYCGAYGFGADGPYRSKSAYDDLIQAGSGLAALSTRLGGEPAYLPTVLCDKAAGQAAAYAVMAALFHRARTGEGQEIETPMFETAVEFAFIEHMQGFTFEPPLGPPGFKRVLSRLRKPFRTADGHACILPYSSKNWRDFFEFTGRFEYADDPRFANLTERLDHIELLYAVVEEEAPKRPTADWVAFCDSVGIPCMPVLDQADLPDDPHLQAVGFFTSGEHPTEGAYRVMRAPVSFSSAGFRVRRHAPRLGEHTAEVCAELGLPPPRASTTS